MKVRLGGSWREEEELFRNTQTKQNRERQAHPVYIKSDYIFSVVTSLSLLFLFSLLVAHTLSCLGTFPVAENTV